MYIFVITLTLVFCAFITMLILFFIEKSKKLKMIKTSMKHYVECGYPSDKKYDVKSDSCKRGNMSAFTYYMPKGKEKCDCIYLEPGAVSCYMWLVTFLVENLGFLVVVPERSSVPVNVLERIYEQKDATHGVPVERITRTWTYIGYVYGDSPTDDSMFTSMVYIDPPNTILMNSNRPSLILDSYYTCCSENPTKFPAHSGKVKNLMNFVRVYGSTDTLYASSCNWSKEKCKDCFHHTSTLTQECQKSATKHIVSMYITDINTFNINFSVSDNTSNVVETDVNETLRMICIHHKMV